MSPRAIIAEAWRIAQREPQLRHWGFFSSFFETLLNLKLIGYQIYFLYAYMNGKTVGLLDDFYWAYDKLPFWLFAIVIVGFVLLLLTEWIFPHLALGAIIGLTAKAHKKEEVKGGLVLALYNFFSIFVIHEFLVLSSWSLIVTICSLTLRYIPGDVKVLIIGVVLLLWLFSIVLRFLFSFAEPAVVIQKTSVFDAMGQSFKLIVSYLSQVMFLLLLLFVISIRVMINAIVILVIPGIVIGLAIVLTMIFSHVLSYAIASIVGMILVVVASYFFGYLHVFKEAVWTITYMQLKRHKDLDVIEG